MQRVLIAIGLVAGLGLAACEQEAPPPPKKKELGRADQPYQGEEKVHKVISATVTRGKDNALHLKAEAQVPSAGYERPGFLPWIYPVRTPDGIYKVDVLAVTPTAPQAPAPTPITAEGDWNKYADDRVKGVTFVSKTNEMTVMVQEPTGKP